MPQPSPLVIRAGAAARRRLEECGFDADIFSTLVGASGGPKWLVLRQLDELWIDRLLAPRKTPLATLGSSIGSFRHVALAQRDPRAAIARFFDAYVGQRYDAPPSQDEVTGQSAHVADVLLGEKGAEEVVTHPQLDTHIVASRLLGPGRDAGLGFKLRIAASAMANALGRSQLRRFYERAVFGPRAPAIRYQDLPTQNVLLSPANLRDALLASGSIPMLMRGIRDIPGISGTWFDGGIVDYHFDFAFETNPGLTLFPHFFDRITPGWFDKALPWRRPTARTLDRVVMVAPSDAFVASLPGGKVPDRNDFSKFSNDERIERWNDIDRRCRVLAEDFVEVVDSGRLIERILPFA